MSTLISATPRPQAQAQGESSGCILQLVAIAVIVFGLIFGYNKTLEFAHGVLRDQDAIDAAEMQMLQGSMNCEPGEVWEIRPLGNHGAKSVRCVPGGNMPRGEPRG